MSESIITRRDSGGYAKVTFDNVSPLSKSIASGFIEKKVKYSATTVGNYALFGGGYADVERIGVYRDVTSTVDAYNTNLIRSTPTDLSVARSNLAATTVGNYGLFGGGFCNEGSDNVFSTVDAYNTNLTRSTPTELSVAREDLAATTVGNYALFGGGGRSFDFYYSTVDAYNTNLTRSTPTDLSAERSSLAATTVGGYALFGGGEKYEYGVFRSLSIVDVYNSSLTRMCTDPLNSSADEFDATTVGDYALFGVNIDSPVSAYYIKLIKIQLYPGTKYKFSNMSSEATSLTFQEITLSPPISGYIKIKDATIN